MRIWPGLFITLLLCGAAPLHAQDAQTPQSPCSGDVLACAMSGAGLVRMQTQMPKTCVVQAEPRMTAVSGLPGIEGWQQGYFGVIPKGADYLSGQPLMAGQSTPKKVWTPGLTLQQWAEQMFAQWHEPSDLSCTPVQMPQRRVTAQRLRDIAGADGIVYQVYAVTAPPLNGRTLVAVGEDADNFLRFFLIGSHDADGDMFAFSAMLNQVGTSLR